MLLRSLMRRKNVESDMDEEMRFHLLAFADDLQRQGVPPHEAMRRARLQFGSVHAAKEECRQSLGFQWPDEFARNVRYAARTLLRSPGFSLAVILTLALCIGANTAIFSVVDAVLFRPYPFPEPDRLGEVLTRVRGRGGENLQSSQDGATWLALQEASGLILAASRGGATGVNLAAGNKAMFVQQHRVSARYFQVLGIAPAMGREFTDSEDRPGGPPVAIVSHKLWTTVFRADPRLLGSTILLRGEPHEVVGITPASFRPIAKADVWTPLRPTPTGEGGGQNYRVAARLKDGVSWAQAAAQIEPLGRGVLQQRKYPPEFTAALVLLPLQQARATNLEKPLLFLQGAVALVLLIGCVNIAGLMLARASTRYREVGTRIALGGGRGAVIRQVFTECMLLAVIGGLAGIAVGYLGAGLLAESARTTGVWQETRLDWRVAGFASLAALLASVTFGLFPAWQTARVDVRSALLDAGSRAVAGPRSHSSRNALLVVQIALGVTLLVASGLMIRTLGHLHSLSPGFEPDGVVTAGVSMQDAKYQTSERAVWLFERTLSQIRMAPGVSSASAGLNIPYQQWLNAHAQVLDGPASQRPSKITTVNFILPGYLETLRIPLLAGRDIDDRDRAGGTAVALVNEAFARTFLAGQEAVGSHIRVLFDGDSRVIAGVTANVQQRPAFGNYGPLGPVPAVYLPMKQIPDQAISLAHRWFTPQWVVRASGSEAPVRASINKAVAAADPMLPVSEFANFDEVRASALRLQRLQAGLLSALAGLALVLAAIGVYGTVSQSVLERTREMGVRIALGAPVRHILLKAVRPGVILAVTGIMLGIGLSLATVRLLRSAVYGVSPTDPVTFAGVSAMLLIVAVLASLMPAIRLAQLDPAITLRAE